MAEDRSVGGLFLRLGLSLSELETGFVNAQQTIAANINRLNREAELVRIRSEIEIAGLDETADAERILQVRQEALNRQMEIQRDRVRILDAELQNLIRTQGENSVAAQRATTTFERARLALADMERQSRELADTQSQTNEGIGELNNLLPPLSPRLQAVAKVFAGIATASGAAGMSVKELLEDFRELQTQSYELNMPFDKTRDFLRELNLGGGDIGDIEGYIRGITDAFVKGEADDPEFIALRKHDAKITDSTGKLKDFKDILDEVYQAWKKADAAGEGIEFLQMTGGESGVRDVIQYFKRHDEILEDSAKLVKAGFSAAEMHELDRAMKLVEAQSKELKDALGDIFVPAAQSAAEQFFETLQAGTKILVENKDEIQSWGFIAAETVKTIKGAFSEAGDKIAELDKRYRADDEALKNLSWRYGGSTSNPYGVDKMIKGMTTPEETKPHDIISGIIERAKKEQEKYNAELAKTQKKFDELNKEQGSPLNQYAEKRTQQFKDELKDLRIDLDIEDEFARARAHLQAELDRELDRKNFLSKEEEKAIKDLGDAKFEQIDRAQKEAIAKAHEEAAAKIQEYWNNAADIEYELTHTAFEKQIRDIEQWEKAQREKADTAEEIAGIVAEAAAKEAQAFEREMDRIKGKMQSLDDKIFEIDHSQYENDLRRIQQDYLKQVGEYQASGMFTPEIQAKLDYLFNRQKQNLDARAKDGGDYTKAPEGAIRRGGNGISVIEGDQIVDDGLKARQAEIGLLVNENQLRAQLMPNLSREAQERVSAIQATRALSDAQKELAQATTQSGYQIIEGDQVVNNPSGYQVIEGDQVVSGLQEFNSAVQGTTATLEQMNQPMSEFETLSAAMAQSESDFQESLKRMAESLPVNYFKTLADNAKAVSDMQFGLTESTMKLIDAQEQLREALNNLPKFDSMIPTSNQQGTNELMNLSTQRLGADIPQDSGMKFGFDWDVFGGLAGLAALIPHPAAKALALGGALGAGAGVGTFNETTAQALQPTQMTFETIVTPLNNIHTVVSNILSEMQNRQPPQITVSPTNQINLGGAYVFDNELKKQLVEDITSDVVDEITQAVTQATSRANYSYGA